MHRIRFCNADEDFHSRCLVVLAATPHDDIRRTGLGPQVLLIHFVARGGLLEERHRSRRHAAYIATGVGRHDTEQTLAGLLGEVGLLEDTLGGVDVGEIQGSSRVAGVENCRETHTRLERPHPIHVRQ